MRFECKFDSVRQQAKDLATRNKVVERLKERDFTLWSPDPSEVANRLGWLDCHEEMQAHIGKLEAFTKELGNEGIERAVLLGMGGSSLAAEVINHVFRRNGKGIEVTILDTTDPVAIKVCRSSLDLSRTLFIAATKSGSTIETLSLLCHFFEQCVEELGRDEACKRFVCITDPGSSLPNVLDSLEFRECFYSDPDIGGRYSALSLFGLVPAAIRGADISSMLNGASEVNQEEPIQIGLALGILASDGCNRLVVSCSEEMKPFGFWVEQLVAESTGKDGKGILPVLDDSFGYENEIRVRINIGDGNSDFNDAERKWDILCSLEDENELGALFFAWELITAAACHVLGVNAFDQPDVEMSKAFARKVMSATNEDNEITALPTHDFAVLRYTGTATAESTADAVTGLLKQAQPHGYVAILSYLSPDPETNLLLTILSEAAHKATGLPVTVGNGPRYLHSTGQLHKGGFDGAVFLVLESEPDPDSPIVEGQGFPVGQGTFGQLRAAQANGDFQALVHAGRNAGHFHLASEESGLKAILEVLASMGSG